MQLQDKKDQRTTRSSSKKRDNQEEHVDDVPSPPKKKKRTTIIDDNNSVTSDEEMNVVEEKINEPFPISSRTTPAQLLQVIKKLNKDQVQAVKDIGFGSLLEMKINMIPARLGHYVVDNFDDNELTINTENSEIKVTAEMISELLGIPSGGKKISKIKNTADNDPVLKKFFKQYPENKQFNKSDIATKIAASKDGGIIFKLNFILLFVNSICKSCQNGNCKTGIVRKLVFKDKFPKLDWGDFILECLRGSKKNWKRMTTKSSYAGPVTVLIVSF